jgi:hypothetical protein
MMKLKLHQEPVVQEPDPGASLRFPVRAVRAMPVPSRTHGPVLRKEPSVPEQERDAMRHPELIRQIENTLTRMQAGIDQLQEHVRNYKFPGAHNEDRPRAA